MLLLFVLVFASAYVSLAQASPDNFSEQLNRTADLYFTISVLSTVGFGDITPKADAARLVVCLQMVLDLVLISVIVKLIIGTARTRVERQRPPPR